MALSAPSARACFRVSMACLGPMVIATISEANFFSFKRMASSTAISQKGLIDILTFCKSIPSGFTLTLIPLSTTLFTATRTFINKLMQKVNLLMIRHAESAFNLASRSANKSTTEVTDFEKESLAVKLNKQLIDCGLTDEGVEQCKQAAPMLASYQIDTVIVSPLRRAIQTAHYLFKDHPSKPKMIVNPMQKNILKQRVREMISSSCDIGGNLSETMKEYPEFDYSQVLATEFVSDYPNLWSVEYIWNPQHQQALKTLLQEKLAPEEFNSNGPVLFLEYMAQFPINTVDNFIDTMERVQKVKSYLLKLKNTACVTHSRFLQTISASNFDDQGHPLDGQWWANCQFSEL